MEHLNELSMELLGAAKTDTTMTKSYSGTNMSKSISGASLSSSLATHRTHCSSGLSSVSTRFPNLSSSPNSPHGGAANSPASSACGGGATPSDATIATSSADPHAPPRAASPVTGGGTTVLAGVAPTCAGKLRRKARLFSGWKEPVYFELRSTALLAFADKGKGGTGASGTGTGMGSGIGGGSGGGGGAGFATLAAKIMHPRHSAQTGVQWSWSADLSGADRIVELPGSSSRQKDLFAFAVEFPAREKKKALVLAAPSAAERERWMVAVRRASRRVYPEEFEPLSVIGEGHFGKVLLVRWNNGSAGSDSFSSSRRGGGRGVSGGRDSRRSPTTPPTIVEGAEEGQDGAAAVDSSRNTNRTISISRDTSTRNVAPVAAAAAADDTDATTRRGRLGDDRYLAVKEVALHKGTSLPGVLNERQILGVLREHPFVVTLRCAWRRGNFLYYGLDFLPGADLFELFRRNAIKMDLQAARVYAGQVALALEHLHDHGICYRDLKPENILVDAKGHLCLADMGLSKILGKGDDAVRTTTVCGTRAYLAPEMVLRKPYGMSVDFWQFGCFVYELYAGHSPFWKPRSGPPGRSHDQTVALILAGEIHYPRSIGPIAKSLIRDLLAPEVDSRLGCRSSPHSNHPSSSSLASSVSCASPSAATAVETAEKKKTLVVVPPNGATPPASPSAIGGGRSSRSISSSSSSSSSSSGVRGWQSVKQHGFFKDMDWEALLRGEIEAPLKPAAVGRGMVGNFAREYTRQRVGWGGDQQELRDVAEKDVLFKRELMGFDFVRD